MLDTIGMLAQKRDVRGTILHSDQGFQYTSHAYNKQLFNLGIAKETAMITLVLIHFSPI
ncbi:hypothetical protein [Bacillus cereus]|uniref:hypothetical protein n=1 Tax=Bacillus cereus TaxID=1396 RepID=UPI0020D27F24|nr:hypothetical protein [Bacillus cereus]